MYVLLELPAGVHPLLGLIPVSVLISLVAVLLVAKFSNQRRLRKHRDQMKGHLLGILIFNHSLRGILRSLGRALCASAVCLREAIVPLLIMSLPLLFVLGRVGQSYSHRPGHPGSPVQISAQFVTMPTHAKLEADEELAAVGPFTFPTNNTIVWEIMPPDEGEYDVGIVVGGQVLEKTVRASAVWPRRVSSARTNGSSIVEAFVAPQEPPLPLQSPLQRIMVVYPRAQLTVLGRTVHWSVIMLVMCVATGWLIARGLHIQL
jgi:hypothetical protein